MGQEQFNHDLAAAKKLEIEGVSKVRRGDSDGEVVFTWSPNDDTEPLDIQILILGTCHYPQQGAQIVIANVQQMSTHTRKTRVF